MTFWVNWVFLRPLNFFLIALHFPPLETRRKFSLSFLTKTYDLISIKVAYKKDYRICLLSTSSCDKTLRLYLQLHQNSDNNSNNFVPKRKLHLGAWGLFCLSMWKTGGEVRKYEMSDRHDDSTYFMVDILKTDLSIQGGKNIIPLKTGFIYRTFGTWN